MPSWRRSPRRPGEALASSANEADPARVADALAAQAAAARRGGGVPGSQDRRECGPGSRPAGRRRSGPGMCLDVMPACPDLALLADAAAGPDDTYPGASDDELIGVLCAWDRTESHAHARKLAAITELRRRRPSSSCRPRAGEPGRGMRITSPMRSPTCWPSPARTADGLAALAENLDSKLPGTRAALLDGVITPVKARIIATATTLLDDERGPRGGGAGAGPGRAAHPRLPARGDPAGGDERRAEEGEGAAGGRRPRRPGGAVGRGLRERRPGRPRTPARPR